MRLRCAQLRDSVLQSVTEITRAGVTHDCHMSSCRSYDSSLDLAHAECATRTKTLAQKLRTGMCLTA